MSVSSHYEKRREYAATYNTIHFLKFAGKCIIKTPFHLIYTIRYMPSYFSKSWVSWCLNRWNGGIGSFSRVRSLEPSMIRVFLVEVVVWLGL